MVFLFYVGLANILIGILYAFIHCTSTVQAGRYRIPCIEKLEKLKIEKSNCQLWPLLGRVSIILVLGEQDR